VQPRKDRVELALGRERCLLAGAVVPGRYVEGEDPLDELARLVDTAGGVIVGRVAQRLDKPHPKTFLGSGKFEELVAAVHDLEADTVVVDDDLSGKQLGALEEGCRAKVIDRTEVILDIFASRARSYQAKLQVELAQLQYQLPRQVRRWTHLERLGGGIGTRGPGESQLESDRRMIRRAIGRLEEELAGIEARKAREVATRSETCTVCLVGYTNAGKSSLMNRLTSADAFVADRLFATLDTLTRKLEIPDAPPILLSDTVGFIRRLPHKLVASFHATLEEASRADLLLHVIDAADPVAGDLAASVESTLSELGMADRPRLNVLNKIDAVTEPALLARLGELLEPCVQVSAHSGVGVPELLARLRATALEGRREVTLRFGAGDGRRLALINEIGLVRETRYEGEEAVVTAILAPLALQRVEALPGACELDRPNAKRRRPRRKSDGAA